MNRERIEELAALFAAGALDGEERREFERLLAGDDALAVSELARFSEVAAAIALARAPVVEPATEVRTRLMERIRAGESARQPAVPQIPGFLFVSGGDENGWQQLPVPGASVKLLSMDEQRGYAVVLGRLEAGASYPPHKHIHSEQVYVLEGDLSIGQRKMKAGDFHQAGAGTRHDVNFSEGGCTILAVISLPDLQAQMQPA